MPHLRGHFLVPNITSRTAPPRPHSLLAHYVTFACPLRHGTRAPLGVGTPVGMVPPIFYLHVVMCVLLLRASRYGWALSSQHPPLYFVFWVGAPLGCALYNSPDALPCVGALRACTPPTLMHTASYVDLDASYVDLGPDIKTHNLTNKQKIIFVIYYYYYYSKLFHL